MKKIISLAAFALLVSSFANAEDGLVTVESNYSVKETANRFESIIKSKGLTLFARIDHQKNAKGVDLKLNPTEVIMFGNPKIGTPLMQCAPNVAIDLPQKVLISEDAESKVWLSYTNPEYLKTRHNIKGCDKVINKVSGVLKNLSLAATNK